MWKLEYYSHVENTFMTASLSTVTRRITRVARRVSHVEQELLTRPVHMSSSPVFSGVRVVQSLVFWVMFCRLLFVLFSFVHCVVFPSSINDFWLPLWCLQTFLFFSLSVEVWYHKTILTAPFFIEVLKCLYQDWTERQLLYIGINGT